MTNKEQKKEETTTEVEYTETEEKALDKGWRPQSDFEGEPETWVDAGEFLRRGELMDRISDQTKQLRSASDKINKLEASMDYLTEHNKKIAEREYDKAYNDLKQQKADAMGMGENLKVVEIDEKIADLKEARKELDSDTVVKEPNRTQDNNQQLSPEMIQWKNDNTWYDDNPALAGAADRIALDYLNLYPDKEGNFQAVLTHVSNKIREEFPEKFNRSRPSAVNDVTSNRSYNKPRGRAKYTFNDLDEVQKEIGKRLVDKGDMTMEKYIQDLADLGELR